MSPGHLGISYCLGESGRVGVQLGHPLAVVSWPPPGTGVLLGQHGHAHFVLGAEPARSPDWGQGWEAYGHLGPLGGPVWQEGPKWEVRGTGPVVLSKGRC